jgi:peptidyl-prolyl cis-trans isomerase SurA
MKRNLGLSAILSIIFLSGSSLYCQKLVESVSAIVGNEVIYLSEVEYSLAQQLLYGDRTPVNQLRCRIFEEMMVSKLFLDQARIDSVEVSEANVEGALNVKMLSDQPVLNRFWKKPGKKA